MDFSGKVDEKKISGKRMLIKDHNERSDTKTRTRAGLADLKTMQATAEKCIMGMMYNVYKAQILTLFTV